MAGLNQEIWTDSLVRQFRETEQATFLNEIPDESRYVSATRGENEVIHLVDIGADPEVLINNTTYPIPSAQQTDGDIAITLDKYQTEVTEVTDDEIQYIAYDKIKVVQDKHVKAVTGVKHRKACHALAPATNTTDTPVLKTTGAGYNGSKRMQIEDLDNLKTKFDEMKIPLNGRVLVLTSQHYNDLLKDARDKKVSIDHLSFDENGMLKSRLSGFKVYQYVDCPYYTVSSLTKKTFDSVPQAGDRQASVAFYAPDMFKAMGRTVNYEDKPRPRTQRWEYNIKHNYIVLPRKQRAIGAIVSDIAS